MRRRAGCLLRGAALSVAAVLLCGLLWLMREPLLRGYGHLLVVDDATPGADAVVVLAGDSLVRIPHALRLLEQGYAPRLLVTSPKLGQTAYRQLQMTEKDVARTILRLDRLVYPLDAVPSQSGGATSTLDEAWDLRAFAGNEGIDHLIAVTSACSTRRARFALRKAFRDTETRVEISAAPNDLFDADDWWLSDKGIQCYVLEPIKLAVYSVFDREPAGIRND